MATYYKKAPVALLNYICNMNNPLRCFSALINCQNFDIWKFYVGAAFRKQLAIRMADVGSK